MKVFRNASASLTTLSSLGALYGVIVVLTVLLSNRVLANPSVLEEGRIWMYALIAAILPLGLFFAVIASILRLLRDRQSAKPGAAFKARLTTFFAVVVALAAVPQGIVAVGVLSSAMQLLFNSNTGTSLRHGLDIALDYYEEQIFDLEVLAADGTLQRVIDTHQDEVRRGGVSTTIWPELLQRDRRIVAFQLFDDTGRTVVYHGEPRYQREKSPSALGPGDVGRVNRITIEDNGLLRLTALVRLPLPGGDATEISRDGVVLVTSELPNQFEERASMITDTIDVFTHLERLRPAFVLYAALLYGVFSLPLLLLSILASFFFSDRIMRPIEALEEATRQVTEGDYSVRILSRPGDDLGVMIHSFNRMVNELDRARRRIAQTEKVQAWQEIAQRLAHEVKNPLTPIRLAAERLQRRFDAGAEDFPSILRRTTDTIVRETEALTRMLDEFRSFARLPDPNPEPFTLWELLEEVGAIYSEDPGILIETKSIDREFTITADRGQLRRVMVNLFRNAVEASGGAVTISCTADTIEQNGEAICRIRIEDDGPGIPEDIRERIFDPYITSKQSGTGLGLAIVERIVYDHNGRITVESAPGSGTTFVIHLPAQLDLRREQG